MAARRPAHRRRNQVTTVESAARSLWKDLADERRTGEVMQLSIEEEVLCVYATSASLVIPSEWAGYRVQVKPYRPPESEFVRRLRGAASAFLGVVEKDPERAMKLAEGAVDTTKNFAQFLQENPAAVKKFLVNNVIAGVAKGVKKKLERG